jgi:hypothetical protein
LESVVAQLLFAPDVFTRPVEESRPIGARRPGRPCGEVPVQRWHPSRRAVDMEEHLRPALRSARHGGHLDPQYAPATMSLAGASSSCRCGPAVTR